MALIILVTNLRLEQRRSQCPPQTFGPVWDALSPISGNSVTDWRVERFDLAFGAGTTKIGVKGQLESKHIGEVGGNYIAFCLAFGGEVLESIS